jgi:hypothetical protein
MNLLLVLLLLFASATDVTARQAPADKPAQPAAMCPAHDMSSLDPHAAMNERGEHGMGFSQTATTHHFLLTPNGGVIQVDANSTDDAANRDNIKMHLQHISHAFQNGDFAIPMFVHDTIPPGVPVMKQHLSEIHFSLEQSSTGGRVIIQTTNKEAIAAIHEFLRFQIREHKTGDPLDTK